MGHTRLDCQVPPDTGRPGHVWVCPHPGCGIRWVETAAQRTSVWGALIGNEREVDGSRGRWLRNPPRSR